MSEFSIPEAVFSKMVEGKIIVQTQNTSAPMKVARAKGYKHIWLGLIVAKGSFSQITCFSSLVNARQLREVFSLVVFAGNKGRKLELRFAVCEIYSRSEKARVLTEVIMNAQTTIV